MKDFDFTIEMFEEVAEKEGWQTKRSSRYKEMLESFVQTDNKTLKLNCPTPERARNVHQSVIAQIKKNHFNMSTWKRNNYVYVIKL